MLLKKVYRRVYADFLMPSRLPEYRQLLARAGRRELSVFLRCRNWRSGQHVARWVRGGRYAIIRQDVDTDVATAHSMWQVEQEVGVSASRYFRLSTLDIPFMRQIGATGGEASYHYEELSSFAKRHRIKDAEGLRSRIDEVIPEFAANLQGFERADLAADGDRRVSR